MEQSFLRRNQKLILYLIVVPILATFSITGTMMYVFAQRDAGNLAHFTLPSGKTIEVDDPMFRDFASNLRSLPFYLGNLRSEEEDSSDSVYRFLMLYHAAVDAGFFVPDSHLSTMIRAFFPSKDQYQSYLSRMGLAGGAQTFEHYLRRGMIAMSYEQSLMDAASVPNGDEVVKSWQEDNEEYTVEYVSFPASESKSKLDAASIGDEELQKYLDGLNDADRKRKFRREAKVSIEGLTLKISSAEEAKFASLLEGQEFPEPEVHAYFDQNRFERFTRPKEEKKEGESAEQAKPFYEFEEVKEMALQELKYKRAMERLLAKAKEEKGKEGFSLDAFGKPYGLETFSISPEKTRAELVTAERFGNRFLSMQAFIPNEGDFSDIVSMAPNDFFFYRVTKKIPEGVPALAEIRERVLEDYLEKKALDLAKEDARAFHTQATVSKAEGEQDLDVFVKAASAQKKTLDSVGPFSKGYYRYQAMEYAKEPQGAGKFLKGYAALFDLKAGEISQPIEDKSNKAFYVGRVVKRELPDAGKIRPADFQRSRMMSQNEKRVGFAEIKNFLKFEEKKQG